MDKRKKQSKEERERIYNKTNGRCAYCGCTLPYEKMQVDHVIPLHLGGRDIEENMLAACRSCNHRKSTLTIDKFRASIEQSPQVLLRDSVTYRNACRFGVIAPTGRKVIFYFESLPKEEQK